MGLQHHQWEKNDGSAALVVTAGSTSTTKTNAPSVSARCPGQRNTANLEKRPPTGNKQALQWNRSLAVVQRAASAIGSSVSAPSAVVEREAPTKRSLGNVQRAVSTSTSSRNSPNVDNRKVP